MAAQVVVLPVCVCGSDDDVGWFCVTCEETLCERCKVAHCNSKKTKNDRVISLSEAKQLKNEGVIGIPTVEIMCNDHHTKEAHFYCETCRKFICSKCLSDIHKPHAWTHLEDAQEKMRTKTEDSIQEARKKLQEIEAATKLNNTDMNKLNMMIDTCKEAITKRCVFLKSAIDSAFEMRIGQLEAFRMVETEELSKIQEENKAQVNTTSKYITEMEKSLNDPGFPNLSDQPSDNQNTFISLLEPKLYLNSKQVSFVPGNISSQDIEEMLGCIDIDDEPGLQTASDHVQIAVERSFRTPNIKIIRTICRRTDGTAWILYDRDRWAYLIDKNGNSVKRVDFGQTLADACFSESETLYLSLLTDQRVRYLSKSGEIGTLISFKYDTKGICALHREILVCVCKPDVSEIHVISQMGYTVRIISPELPGLFKLTMPGRLTVLPNNRITVIDWNDNVNVNVVSFDQHGNDVKAIKLQGLDTSGLFDLTCDDEGNVFVTDFKSHIVHKIQKNGVTGDKLNIVDLDKKVPSGIAFIKPNMLWIGAQDGMIYEIKY